MTQVILFGAGGYLALLLALFVFQRNLMYHPGTPLKPLDETMIPDAQVHHLESDTGQRLQSWYLPPQPGKPVVVFFHGNAGTIADRDFKVAPWRDAGYGVWLTGYRGFSGNAGLPSESGLYADARTAIEKLINVGIEPAQMVLYGESLGTGVATQMAFERAAAGTPVRGLILEAPFLSMGAAAQFRYPYVPAKWLVRDKYLNHAKIEHIDAPLLLIHGDQDRVLPQSHGRTLFDTAKHPKQAVWLEGAGHTDVYDFGAGDAVMKFLETLN